MATIKTNTNIQGFKNIILRNGKVSCECCPCRGPTSGYNVFEITKQQYEEYRNGGTWNVSTYWSQYEFVPGDPSNCTAVSIITASTSEQASGCAHSVSAVARGQVTYTGPCSGNITFPNEFAYGISIELGEDSLSMPFKYYVKYSAGSNVSDSNPDISPTGFPPNIEFTVDGNNLIGFGYWRPNWSVFDGYTNDSKVTLTATFTPNS
jgi:hypothetical protein